MTTAERRALERAWATHLDTSMCDMSCAVCADFETRIYHPKED